MTCTKMENDTSSHLVKKSSSLSPVILFNTCLERVAEACNAEIANLLRLQLTPDSVHKLLLATASLLLEFWSAVNIESEKEVTAWIDWSTVNLSKARLLRALSCTNLPAKKSRTNYQCCKWYCTGLPLEVRIVPCVELGHDEGVGYNQNPVHILYEEAWPIRTKPYAFDLTHSCVYSECHRMSHLHKVTGSWVLCLWRDGTHETSVVKNRRKHWRDPSPMQERAKHDCMPAWIFWMCIESTEEQACYAIYARENGENRREYHRLPCSSTKSLHFSLPWQELTANDVFQFNMLLTWSGSNEKEYRISSAVLLLWAVRAGKR